MKIKHPNTQALASAITLAGAVFFGAPGALAQQTPPPAPTQPAIGNTPPATTPPPAAPPPAAPPAAGQPAAPAPPVESKIHAAPPAPPAERHVTTPVIAAGAISGVGLAGGVIFGILAAGKNSTYKKNAGTPEDLNKTALDGERNAFISDVSFGVCALFGLTAIALYLIPDEPTPVGPEPGAPAPAPAAARASAKKWITTALKGEVFSF